MEDVPIQHGVATPFEAAGLLHAHAAAPFGMMVEHIVTHKVQDEVLASMKASVSKMLNANLLSIIFRRKCWTLFVRQTIGRGDRVDQGAQRSGYRDAADAGSTA